MRGATLRISFCLCFFSLSASHLLSQFELDEVRVEPQIGLWFGPVLPFPATALSDVLTTSLGGGLFFRMNVPTDNLKTEIGTSISFYESSSTEALLSVPSYAAVSYTIPIDSPILFQFKLGGGINYIENQPERNHNALPAFFQVLKCLFPQERS